MSVEKKDATPNPSTPPTKRKVSRFPRTRKVIKIGIISLVSVLLLINIFVITFFYSGRLQNFMIKKALPIVNSALDVEIRVGSLTGNLFREFTFHDLELYEVIPNEPNHLVGSIESLSVKWNVKEFWKFKISVQSVELNNIYGHVVLDETGVNFDRMFSSKTEYTAEELLKKAEKKQKKEHKKRNRKRESRFKFRYIVADKVSLNGLRADFDTVPKNQYISQKIEIDTIIASFSMIHKAISAGVSLENIRALDPNIRLEHLEVNADIHRKNIVLNNLQLFTENSILSAEGAINLRDFSSGIVDLKFNPLHLQDFDFLLDSINYQPDMSIEFELKAQLAENIATVDFKLKEKEMEISTTATLYDYLDVFQGEILTMDNNFTGSIEIHNLEVFKYLNMFTDSDLTGNKLSFHSHLDINAQSFDIHRMNALIDIDFQDIDYNDTLLDEVKISAVLDKKDVDLALKISAIAGEIEAGIQLRDFIDQQLYQLSIDMNSFEVFSMLPEVNRADILSKISLEEEALQSSELGRLQGKVIVSGQYFHPDSMIVSSTLDLSGSSILTNSLDSLFVSLEVKDKEYNLSDFVIQTSAVNLSGYAKATQQELIEANISLFVANPEELIKLFVDEAITFETFLYLNAEGKWSELRGNVFTQINDICMRDMSIERVIVDHQLFDLGKLHTETRISMQNARLAGFLLQNADLSAPTMSKDMYLNFDLVSHDLADVSLNSHINWENGFHVLFNHLRLRNGFVDWQNLENFSLIVDDDIVLLKNFNLFSKKQSIISDTIEKKGDDIQMNIAIKNLQIKEALNNFAPEINIDGKLDLAIDLAVKDNQIFTDIEGYVSDISLFFEDNDLPLLVDYLTFQGTYDNQTLRLSNQAKYKDSQINTTASLPLVADLKNNTFDFSRNDSIDVMIDTKDLNLDFVNFFLPPKNTLTAAIDVDLEVKGTAFKPLFKGHVKVDKGNFRNSMFGMNYNNIATDIEFFTDHGINAIFIHGFKFDTGKGRNRGTFDLSGYSNVTLNDLNSTDESLIKIGDTRLNLLMENLQLTNHKAIRTNASGRLALNDIKTMYQNNKDKFLFLPKFALQGSVTTNEVKINLDEMAKITTIEVVPEPLLVVAQNRMATPDIIYEKPLSFKVPEFEVNFRVELPRNVWLQSKEMSLELSGSANYRILQNNQFILANVEVVRGYIEYFSRRFNIEEGIVSITGDDLSDIHLNLKANYIFRKPDKNSSILTLAVEGTMLAPAITFYQDGELIEEEADAISLILFGVRMNDDESSDNSALMTELGAGILSAELANSLQKQLGVDVVSIQMDSDFAATLTIGNYIGKRLFISYERKIDYNEFNAVSADRVNLEYQLAKNIFLITSQGVENENGIDLIFRWSKNENSSRRY
ncbi:MAG: translocation/assembly module TamB domain-containing protein [Candidatus Cloacimonetes bacterium]|nr:translocation/assembly module TamB domain-containing protein [Candidatus Cloacimonadota bacterium]